MITYVFVFSYRFSKSLRPSISSHLSEFHPTHQTESRPSCHCHLSVSCVAQLMHYNQRPQSMLSNLFAATCILFVAMCGLFAALCGYLRLLCGLVAAIFWPVRGALQSVAICSFCLVSPLRPLAAHLRSLCGPFAAICGLFAAILSVDSCGHLRSRCGHWRFLCGYVAVRLLPFCGLFAAICILLVAICGLFAVICGFFAANCGLCAASFMAFIDAETYSVCTSILDRRPRAFSRIALPNIRISLIV